MRVLAVNQFYSPDTAATAQLLGDLCEDLARQGCEVSVLASRKRYVGAGELPARELRNGVHVHRVRASSFGRSSMAARLADYTSFGATSFANLLSLPRPDVLLALTTPPLLGLEAALVSAMRGVPLISWVQDIYPDIAVELGVLPRTHALTAGIRRLMALANTHASRVVALSDGMADRLVVSGVRRERIVVLPNWADGESIRPVSPSASTLRAELSVPPDHLVVMYSGNLGAGHDVGAFVRAIRALRDEPFTFVFIGAGVNADPLRAEVGAGRVHWLDYRPREALSDSLGAADVHLSSLKQGFDGLMVPSKLYGVLAAGRPLVHVGPANCEITRVVEAEGVGLVVRPGDGEGLAEALRSLRSRGDERLKMGVRARALFEESYERRVVTRRWLDLCQSVGDEAKGVSRLRH